MVRRIEKGRDAKASRPFCIRASLTVRRSDKGTVLIEVLLPLCE